MGHCPGSQTYSMAVFTHWQLKYDCGLLPWDNGLGSAQLSPPVSFIYLLKKISCSITPHASSVKADDKLGSCTPSTNHYISFDLAWCLFCVFLWKEGSIVWEGPVIIRGPGVFTDLLLTLLSSAEPHSEPSPQRQTVRHTEEGQTLALIQLLLILHGYGCMPGEQWHNHQICVRECVCILRWGNVYMCRITEPFLCLDLAACLCCCRQI